jgi:hypothetical protein
VPPRDFGRRHERRWSAREDPRDQPRIELTGDGAEDDVIAIAREVHALAGGVHRQLHLGVAIRNRTQHRERATRANSDPLLAPGELSSAQG